MGILDFLAFQKEVKILKNFPPAALFVGDEESLLWECLAQISSAFFARYGREFREFNYEVLYGDRDAANKILDSLGTLPFGSEKKLVVLHRFEKLSEAGKEDIALYLSSPNPSICLVLLWNAKPNAETLKKEVPAQISRIGMVVKCWSLQDERRVGWIENHVGEMGMSITAEAARLLSEEGGEGLRDLKFEVEKLVLLAGDKKEIGIGEVRKSASFSAGEDAWTLAQEIQNRNFKAAGKILERCLKQGEEPVKILNLMAAGARRANLPPKLREEIFSELKRADRLLKSGHGVESGVFESWMALCEAAN